LSSPIFPSLCILQNFFRYQHSSSFFALLYGYTNLKGKEKSVYREYDAAGEGGYFRGLDEIRADISSLDESIDRLRQDRDIRPRLIALLDGGADGDELISALSELIALADKAELGIDRLYGERRALMCELRETGWAMGY
jgi:hypothetical protein